MENKRRYRAVKENVKGDFYVKDGCCTLCGVPYVEAPELFGGFDQLGNISYNQCFVKKQPENIQELSKMINTMAMQEIDCIRYCGQNNDIKQKIKSVGEQGQID